MLSSFIFRKTIFTKGFILGLTLAIFATTAIAWTGPSGTPPNNNVAAPINVSTSNQIKDGSLGVGALAVYGNQYTQGNLGVGVPSPGQKIDVNGNVRATAFLYSSDQTLKTDVATLVNSIEIIKNLRGVSFTWKDTGREDIGLIAQEVESVSPQSVHTDPVTGLKSVEYGNLIAPLIEVVKAQQKELETLKQQIQELQKQTRELQSK